MARPNRPDPTRRAARSNSLNGYLAFGASDCKLAEAGWMTASRTAYAVNGPTWDAQPVFAWNEQVPARTPTPLPSWRWRRRGSVSGC